MPKHVQNSITLAGGGVGRGGGGGVGGGGGGEGNPEPHGLETSGQREYY